MSYTIVREYVKLIERVVKITQLLLSSPYDRTPPVTVDDANIDVGSLATAAVNLLPDRAVPSGHCRCREVVVVTSGIVFGGWSAIV